jgi:hypothetical protein
MGDHRYEVVYNVGLLDDVHNYFPALLYDSGRFRSITEVFHYIRHQMNTRFNLFSYGAGLAAERAELHHTGLDAMPTVILTPQMAPAPPPTAAQTADIFSNLQTTNLLLSMLGLGTDPTPPARGNMTRLNNRWASFRDVVVRPTGQQIEAATEILNGAALAEETRCAVCQDVIGGAETCRRLRHCSHTYHQTCIDQWFLRSVYCPTCRHDVREGNDIRGQTNININRPL